MKPRIFAKLFIAALFVLATAVIGFGQTPTGTPPNSPPCWDTSPGCYDSNFNYPLPNGTVTPGLTITLAPGQPDQSWHIHRIVGRPDSTGFYAVGWSETYSVGFVLSRNPDGSPDTVFNGNGLLVFGNIAASFTDAVVISDGRLVVGGVMTNGQAFAFRLGRNGAPDGPTVFGPSAPPCLGLPRIALQGDGSVVLGCDIQIGKNALGQNSFRVMRFRNSNTGFLVFDTSFGGAGTGGIVDIKIARKSNTPSRFMVIGIRNTDNRIVLGGWGTNDKGGNTGTDLVTAQLNPDGTLYGVFYIAKNGDQQTVPAVRHWTMDSAGNVYALTSYPLVCKIKPDSTLDTNYGSSGCMTPDWVIGTYPASTMRSEVLLQPWDNSLLVTGNYFDPNRLRLVYVRRFFSNGSPDFSFISIPIAESIPETSAIVPRNDGTVSLVSGLFNTTNITNSFWMSSIRLK